jgi:hypothetical protein
VLHLLRRVGGPQLREEHLPRACVTLERL